MKTKINLVATAIIFTVLIFSGNLNVSATEVKAKASGYENISEPVLNIENWMVNEKSWESASINIDAMEIENRLEMEEWMISSYIMDISNFIDESLTVKDWMVENSKWVTVSISESKETPLGLESWMIDESLWNSAR